MRTSRYVLFLGCVLSAACRSGNADPDTPAIDKADKYQALFSAHPEYRSDGFDYPVGWPDGEGYYSAQGFGGERHHLGDDWNGRGGGNSDLGHAIHAIANGHVTTAHDHGGGWGNVVRVMHLHEGRLLESLYAHCRDLRVTPGTFVRRGDVIATIGNNGGMYLAHLHLELRDTPDLPLGAGYGRDATGHLDPTDFIRGHRPPKGPAE